MKKKIHEMTQPMYDFQAQQVYDIMIKNGISKTKATKIVQKYVDKYGLIGWNGEICGAKKWD